jgi:hypothetical protein
MLSSRATSPTLNQGSFGFSTDRSINWYTNTFIAQSAASAVLLNTWYHAAVCRISSAVTIYLNGAVVATGSDANSYTGTNITMGGNVDNSSVVAFFGYIDDVRITIGSSRYTAAFNCPDGPFPNQFGSASDPWIANVSCLIPFQGTNGQTAISDIEGVAWTNGGGVSLTSGISHSGATCGFFTGATTAYLNSSARATYGLGTGDFTVEAWANFSTASGTARGIFQISGTAGGFETSLTGNLAVGQLISSGFIEIYLGTGKVASTFTPTANTWCHMALVRISGVLTLYMNGVSAYSAANTFNFTGTNMVVGGYSSTAQTMNGYLQDFRLTKGVGRYVNNFTPPPLSLLTQ